MNKLYRYEIQYTSEDGGTQVRLREFPIIKETEHSYFIKKPEFYMKNKVIRKNAMNCYAYDDKEKAREHFIRRTKTRIRWFEFWIEECKAGLELIENIK